MTRFLFGSSAGGHVATPVTIANGGTGATAAQAAIDALTQVSGGSENEVLTKDGSGNAVWAAASGLSSPLTSDLTVNDNISIKYGTGGDATFKYDGSNLLINPKAVGSGVLKLSGGLTFDGTNLVLGAREDLTVSSGVVTATQSKIAVTPETGSSDDLDTINSTGQAPLLIIGTITSAADVTLKDGVDNLYMAGDFTLSVSNDTICFVGDNNASANSGLFELSRSNNT